MAGTGLELFTPLVFAAVFFFPVAADFLALVDLLAAGFLSILLPSEADPSFSPFLFLFATDFPRS
jgi:hypothetical protein